MLREYLSNIADKFRTYLDTTEPINAQDFAGKVEDVAVRYNQLGFTNGYNLGLEEGKPLGKLELLQNSEYMNAKVSGTAIAVNDVSPIEHSVGCKVASKNLFDGTISKGLGLTGSGNNRTVYADNTAGYKILKVEPNTTYCISGDYKIVADGNVRVASFTEYPTENSVSNLYAYGTNVVTFTTTATDNYLFFWFILSATASTTNINIQLEKGISQTEYVPFVNNFSTVEVSRYGKNLCSDDFADWFTNTSPYAYRYIANTDWMLSIRDKDTSVDASGCYFGITSSTDNNREIGWAINNGKVTISGNVAQNLSRQTTSQGVLCPYLIMYPTNEETLNKIMQRWDIQVELGTTATPYEPYREPATYTAKADGTVEGVTSISPNMTLLTNNNNVIINANYLRDIDTYIDNLKTNVALTGGE